jgi:hypothetical protein
MDQTALAELQRKARALRRHIIRMIHESGTAGHYGGSLSCVEILACLFFRHLGTLIGGLASAASELLAAHHPVPMAFAGVNDVFGESGSEEELYRAHGLTAQGISEKVLLAISRKSGGV